MESTLNFSASETKLLLSILQYNKGTISVSNSTNHPYRSADKHSQPDWEMVAQQCGYNNANTARASWSRVQRNKLGGPSSDAPTNGVDKSPTKKSPSKPKKASGEPDSPTKAKGSRGGKKKDVKVDGIDHERAAHDNGAAGDGVTAQWQEQKRNEVVVKTEE